MSNIAVKKPEEGRVYNSLQKIRIRPHIVSFS